MSSIIKRSPIQTVLEWLYEYRLIIHWYVSTGFFIAVLSSIDDLITKSKVSKFRIEASWVLGMMIGWPLLLPISIWIFLIKRNEKRPK